MIPLIQIYVMEKVNKFEDGELICNECGVHGGNISDYIEIPTKDGEDTMLVLNNNPGGDPVCDKCSAPATYFCYKCDMWTCDSH
jgi:hypothetical protein